MKKVLATVFACLATLCIANAQDPQLEWGKNIGGVGTTTGNSIAVDASGNTYITGTFSGKTDFDPGPDTLFLTPTGYFDIFILKVDASGKLLWAKKIGGDSECKPYAVATDQAGNIYTTGSYKGTVDFNPNEGEFILSATNSGFVRGSDIFVVKLAPSGEFLWAASMGGSRDDYASAIAIDKLGNVLTTGRFEETADFDPGSQNYFMTASTNEFIDGGDVFVSKLTTNGKFVWAKKFSGSSDEAGTGIAVDNEGNVFTTGYFSDTTDFDPSDAVVTMIPTGNNDAFVTKLDASGKFLWAKQIGNTSFDEGLSIATDSFGNVYTTGFFTGSLFIDIEKKPIEIATTSGNIYILKMNTDGEALWVKNIKGAEATPSVSVTVDKIGSTYFSNGLGMHKLNANGDELWSKPGIGSSITVDVPGNIYLTGTFKGVLDVDPNDGVTTLSSNGLADAFVVKLSQGASDVAEIQEVTSSVYPNPAQRIVTVTFGEYLNDVTVELTSMLGQTIERSQHIGGTSQSFDITALASGIYSCEVTSGSKRIRQRFVKE